MENSNFLKEVAETLIPNYTNMFNWEDIWDRPISSGTAFEWVTLAALIAQAQSRGYSYSFPLLNIEEGEKLFYLRNEIPRHYIAKVGHSDYISGKFTLSQRFLQSLIPKVLLEKEGNFYSVFREGCPYHKLMYKGSYDDRPDIMIIPGKLTEGFPILKGDQEELHFSYNFNKSLGISGILRIVNSAKVPLRSREPREGLVIPVTGIVECSVNKSKDIAEEQLGRYKKIFNNEENELALSLVTGNKIPNISLNHKVINIPSLDNSLIIQEFKEAADEILNLFNIL